MIEAGRGRHDTQIDLRVGEVTLSDTGLLQRVCVCITTTCVCVLLGERDTSCLLACLFVGSMCLCRWTSVGCSCVVYVRVSSRQRDRYIEKEGRGGGSSAL